MKSGSAPNSPALGATSEDWTGRFVRSDKKLGNGTIKLVYQARDEEEGVDVAWNELDTTRASEETLTKFRNEIEVLQGLEHSNVLKCTTNFTQGKKIVFITELMPGGTLKAFISQSKNHRLKLRVTQKVCRQLVKALEYLHSKEPPVIHSNLMCENVFIDAHNCQVKVGDFGLSGRFGCVSTRGHRLEFMAPEILAADTSMYTCKGDVYAFGMCVVEMVTGQIPYAECQGNLEEIKRRVQVQVMPEALDQIPIEEYRICEGGVQANVREFIIYCVAPFEVRPSSAEVGSHLFIRATIPPEFLPSTHPTAEKQPANGSATASPVPCSRSPSFPQSPQSPSGFVYAEAVVSQAVGDGANKRADEKQRPMHAEPQQADKPTSILNNSWPQPSYAGPHHSGPSPSEQPSALTQSTSSKDFEEAASKLASSPVKRPMRLRVSSPERLTRETLAKLSQEVSFGMRFSASDVEYSSDLESIDEQRSSSTMLATRVVSSHGLETTSDASSLLASDVGHHFADHEELPSPLEASLGLCFEAGVGAQIQKLLDAEHQVTELLRQLERRHLERAAVWKDKLLKLEEELQKHGQGVINNHVKPKALSTQRDAFTLSSSPLPGDLDMRTRTPSSELDSWDVAGAASGAGLRKKVSTTSSPSKPGSPLQRRCTSPAFSSNTWVPTDASVPPTAKSVVLEADSRAL
eukprot:GGOE01027945.1.p1 GENE.GGOE01027945.1~~GGOE01027945.1.p1  ORF type:complete len:691 (+),score=177.42 GGOE01027945.1:68-2140(+)